LLDFDKILEEYFTDENLGNDAGDYVRLKPFLLK
jgi:hypothetical protein